MQDTGALITIAEIISIAIGNAKGKNITFFYYNKTKYKIFLATIINYLIPSFPIKKRYKLVTNLIKITYRDLFPNIFISLYSKFLYYY